MTAKWYVFIVVVICALSLGLNLANPAEGISVKELSAQRDAAIKTLIGELSTPEKWNGPPPASAIDAMKLLGTFRAPESVPTLIRLMKVTTSDVKGRPSVLEDFPAAVALVDIGLPAVGPLLDAASKDDDSVWIVSQILTRMMPSDCAKIFIKQKLEKSQGENDVKRLERLLDMVSFANR